MRITGYVLLLCFLCGALIVPTVPAQDKPSKPEVINMLPIFHCGDELRPGVSYKQLAGCYEHERTMAMEIAKLYRDRFAKQDSFTIEGKVYSDLRSLAEKYNELNSDYNDLANKCNANLKSWAAEESECNAQAAQQVADYNALVGQYNSLLRTGKAPVVNTPFDYRVYTPPPSRGITCTTVFNTTTCY
jgi:hypothetical protein